MKIDHDQPALFDFEPFVVSRRCQVCGGAFAVEHEHLYVVARQVWVKIGATNNLRRRINELSRPAWSQHILSPRGMDWNAPLRVLGVIDGGGYAEHWTHQFFADFHVRGEWFADNQHIRRWIREVS